MTRTTRFIFLIIALTAATAGLLLINRLLGQPAARALPVITPTLPVETSTPVFSATLSLVPSTTTLIVGQVLTMKADLTVSTGCQYPIFELSMHEAEEQSPLFDSIDPPIGIITGPISLPSEWTYRAVQPGITTFEAQTFGERYCNDYWNWHYEYAESTPITILEGEQRQFIPFIVHDR